MNLPTIAVLATGGTIAGTAASAADLAGYTAGTLDAGDLLAAVPGLGALAHVRAETLFHLDSKDMSPAHWLSLAGRVQALADDPAVDGVVITHGTDTLEETAFFLHLVLATAKPVVLTAAMRPATALSADGPLNLYDAVAVAASAEFRALGVLVVMAGAVCGARDVVKWHTRAAHGLGAADGGALGSAHPPALERLPRRDTHAAVARATLAAARWPAAVEVLYLGAGSNPALLNAAVATGLDGVVLALPGNGSVPCAWHDAIDAALAAGVAVVGASRVAHGPVAPTHLRPGMYCAGRLGPAKARVALMVALAAGDAALFERYAYST